MSQWTQEEQDRFAAQSDGFKRRVDPEAHARIAELEARVAELEADRSALVSVLVLTDAEGSWAAGSLSMIAGRYAHKWHATRTEAEATVIDRARRLLANPITISPERAEG